MTTIPPYAHSGRAFHLLNNLMEPIGVRTLDLMETERELAALNGTTCTGNITWRDRSNHKTPKMVITHAMGHSCPIHGEPATDQDRLRVYIGTKAEAQTDAWAAIDREEDRKTLDRRVTDLRRVLDQAISDIKAIYNSLGFQPPQNDQPPQPNPNWKPAQARYRYY